MQVSVLLCETNPYCWFSRFLSWIAPILGYGKLDLIHAAILVDTTDLGGAIWVYDLTNDGINTSSLDDFNEPIKKAYTAFYNKEDLQDLKYVGDLLNRVTSAIELDIKLDVTDLVRLVLRRPLQNHTCVSFVRCILGCDRDETIRTCNHLEEELIHDGRYQQEIN